MLADGELEMTTFEDKLYRWSIIGAFTLMATVLWATKAPAQQPAPNVPPAPQTQPAPRPPGTTLPSPPAPQPEIKPLSPDFQAGFCAGWNSAYNTEQQRFGNWRALVQLGQPAPDSPASVAVGSVQLYILIQSLTPGASLSLNSGQVVTCVTEEKK